MAGRLLGGRLLDQDNSLNEEHKDDDSHEEIDQEYEKPPPLDREAS